jgi:HEAT repeat protein
MGLKEAAPKIAALMAHADTAVRIAVTEAAQQLGETTTTNTLVGALSDTDRDVRVASARALAVLEYERAGPILEELVTSKEIRLADLTEKIAIFESYGGLGGHSASTILGGLLNGKRFFRWREPSEIRASAARGLGKVGLPLAQQALLMAKDDPDAVVRTAVRQAIQGATKGTEGATETRSGATDAGSGASDVARGAGEPTPGPEGVAE